MKFKGEIRGWKLESGPVKVYVFFPSKHTGKVWSEQ